MENDLYCHDRRREHPSAALEWFKFVTMIAFAGVALFWLRSA